MLGPGHSTFHRPLHSPLLHIKINPGRPRQGSDEPPGRALLPPAPDGDDSPYYFTAPCFPRGLCKSPSNGGPVGPGDVGQSSPEPQGSYTSAVSHLEVIRCFA